MVRYIVLGLASTAGAIISTTTLAQTAFNTDSTQQVQYLLAKGQEEMGTSALDDSVVDMTPDTAEHQQTQRRSDNEQPDSPAEKADGKNNNETTREPTKWREDSNFTSYLGGDEG